MTWISVLGRAFYIGHDRATCPIEGINNTIGWTPILSCVGFSTSTCRKACYADKHNRDYANTRNTLSTNWKSVTDVDAEFGEDGLTQVFSTVLRTVLYSIQRRNERRTRENLKPIAAVFRWTWSGEIWSANCARAIVRAHAENPGITGWAYTRALPHVDHLIPAIRAQQLRIMLSADKTNCDAVEQKRDEIATSYGVSLPVFRMIDDIDLKGVACPKITNKRQFPLAKSAGMVGPCVRCGICVDPKRKAIDVLVPIH